MQTNDLVAPGDEVFVSEILYRYDYMAGCPDLSQTQICDILGLWDSSAGEPIRPFPRLQVDDSPRMNHNSVMLYPANAGLPWYSTIPVLRQSKHWRCALFMAQKILTPLAMKDTPNTALTNGSRSYVDKVKIEVNVLNHNWCRYLYYTYPAADERRIELITGLITLTFLFDDIWETNDEGMIRMIQKDFMHCLQLPNQVTESSRDGEDTSPIQEIIIQTLRGFNEEDSKCGNGGKDVVNCLIEHMNHPPPGKEFNTLTEYIDYRIDDAASRFLFACVKFSLGSSVKMDSPNIERFTRIASEHICYANDIGSYDKEKAAYDRGDASHLINAVDVLKRVFKLPDDKTAKSVTLALQKQKETELGRELERLRESGDATAEELEYVEAVVYALMGNMFCLVVMPRYGGEGSRLKS